MSQRLLVTGASGFVGWNLCREARTDWAVFGLVHQAEDAPPGATAIRADLRDSARLPQLLDECAPAAVVHLAAVADTGACQRDPAGTYPLNVAVPARLAWLCAERSLPFAFASTDLVFAGTAAPYAETASPDPVCLYGRQKALAEELVLAAHPGALVCRLPLMFGAPSPRSGAFLAAFLRGLQVGNPQKLFIDEYRTPADARCVSKGILALLGKAAGIYHLGGPERLSRHALGQLVAARLGFPPELLIPVRQADVSLACPRPPVTFLDSSRARRFGFSPLSPVVALEQLDP
ncbi:MAG: sugar nucleotide-binding protein [Lentisphaeria bacterium]|nr:sugar nucleotide-binding protein [Lentisphaeria bacterium]